MMNNFVLIGRVVKIEKKEDTTILLIETTRNYKNDDGVYYTDILAINLFGNIADNTIEYCNEKDLVGVKGKIETKDNKMVLIAEKLTFLASKKNDENE